MIDKCKKNVFIFVHFKINLTVFSSSNYKFFIKNQLTCMLHACSCVFAGNYSMLHVLKSILKAIKF